MVRSAAHPRRSGRSHWAAVAFLFSFVLILIAVCYFYLFPALEAYKHGSPQERARLRAYSALLVALLLFVLIAGLLLTVRIGRFFFPQPDSPRVKTKYIDAWSESGKRMDVPPEDEAP